MSVANSHQPSNRETTLEQFCYEMAYFLLPQFAYRCAEAFRAIIHSKGPQKGRRLYEFVCKFRGVAPNAELARQFLWDGATINDKAVCYTLEYPQTPVVDLLKKSVDENLGDNPQLVLAPYFSAFVHEWADESKFEYYVLGQGLIGGATLRSVTADGRNLRLADVDDPSQQSLYAALGEARSRMK